MGGVSRLPKGSVSEHPLVPLPQGGLRALLLDLLEPQLQQFLHVPHLRPRLLLLFDRLGKRQWIEGQTKAVEVVMALMLPEA